MHLSCSGSGVKSNNLESLVLHIPTQAKWNKFGCILLGLHNYLIWNVLILVSAVLNYIFVTVDLAFSQENYEIFLTFYIIFDIIYLLNLILLVLNKTVNLTSIRKPDFSIAVIVIDFISLVPQILLLLLFANRSFSIFIPLLRISSILRLRHLLLFWKSINKLPENGWKWFIAQYVTIVCLFVHTTICIWFLIQYDTNCHNQLNKTTRSPFKNPIDWYFRHIYYSIQIFFNIGFGDTFPRCLNELYLFSVMLLTGQALALWLICNLSLLLINYNYHKVYMAHKIKDTFKYTEITDEITKAKISQYYSMKENNNKCNTFMDCLPPSLKQDVYYDLNCGLLHRSMILKELPESILKKISLCMKTVLLPSGESIYIQYVIKTYMVCIEEGILEVLNDEDEESPVIFFRDGTILGEVALFFNIPSKATVRAGKNTELRLLHKKDFLEIMINFPEHFKSLQIILSRRLMSANRPHKTIQKFCLPSLRRLKVKLSNIFVKDENNEELDEEYYNLYKLGGDKYVLNEANNHSRLLNIWKAVSDIGQIVFCVVYPYYSIFEQNVPDYLNYFGTGADVACFFDLVLQSTTPIKSEGKIITKIPQILNQKLYEWKFNIDIISLFPLEVWSFLFKNRQLEHRFFYLFKLNRLLRLHRIPRILKSLHGNNNYLMTAKLFDYLVYSILCLYYSACILYLNACFGFICYANSWFYLIPRKEYQDIEDSRASLIESFYFTITSIFLTGTGDILPKSESDFGIIIFLILLFLILKSYWLGQTISCMFLNILCSGYLKTKYYINYLVEIHRIPSNLKSKIAKFLKINPNFYRETCKEFVHGTGFNSIEYLIKMPRINDIWTNIAFFKNMDPYFLAVIENEIKSWLIPKNEVVYFYGDPTRRMFIVNRGYCELYDPDNNFKKTVGPGSALGLLEMIYCLSKRYTVTTKTDCELFYLDYFIIDDVFKLFPEEMNMLDSIIFQKSFLENVAILEKTEDSYEYTEVKDPTEIEEQYFINLSKTWIHYYDIYKKKLGPFWFLGFFLLPVTIYPESFVLKLWCIIRSCFIVLQIIIHLVVIMVPSFGENLSWIAWICQSTLYVDMYISLHIGYYDGHGKIIVHPAYTSWHYLTHGFLLDLIAAIPWSYFLVNLEQPRYKDTRSGFNRVVIHSNLGFWNLLKFIQFYKVFKCISYFEEDYGSMESLKILKLLLVITLTSNVLTAIGIRCICEYSFENSKRRNFKFMNQSHDFKWNKMTCDEGFSTNFWTTDISGIYTNGLYVIFDWLTGTGTGKFIPTTNVKITAILVVFIGFFLFAIMTSVICTMMLAKAEETIDFRCSITKLVTFLKKYNINANLRQMILGHFNLIWDKTKGFNLISNIDMDTYFRDKVLMNYYEEILYDVPLLYHYDTSYIRLVLNLVRIQHFQKDEVIVKYKDVLSDIYIVTSGQVEIFSKTKDPLCLIGAAGVFGNLRKKDYAQSTVTVEARRNVELWVLKAKLFFKLVTHYPLIMQELDNILKGNPAYLLPRDITNLDSFNTTKDLMDETESDEEGHTKQMSNMDFTRPKQRFNCPWTHFTFKPDHVVFKIMSFVTFIASLLNVFIIPYIFVTQEKHYWGYIYLCFEPVFYLRILLKTHQSYTNLHGNLITSKSRICRKYLNTPRQFIWDIVPNLPVTLICYIFPSDERFFYYTSMRLFHLLRFYYIQEYFQYCKKQLFRCNIWLSIELVVYYSILIHVLSCIWFMLACPFNECLSDSWITQIREDIFRQPTAHKIVLSYYYILNLVTTTGIGDILPKTFIESVFTIITMLIGKIYISVLIGTVLNAMYISRKDYLKYNIQTMLLKEYLNDKNISDFQLQRISSYLKNLWIHEQCPLNSEMIFNNFSYPLQQEVMAALYGNQIRHSLIFKGIDESLLFQICTKLKRTLYFKDDYIIKTGDINSTMYFIHTGNVMVLTKHPQLTETKHLILRTMDTFGVRQGFNFEKCHTFYYRATSDVVEILSLKYDDWSYLLNFFYRDKQQLFVRVQKEFNK